MKAVVLCAGAGVRLRPLTHVRPKHLLPVGGRAVLDWVLCDLVDAGVSEVIVVVPPEHYGTYLPGPDHFIELKGYSDPSLFVLIKYPALRAYYKLVLFSIPDPCPVVVILEPAGRIYAFHCCTVGLP